MAESLPEVPPALLTASFQGRVELRQLADGADIEERGGPVFATTSYGETPEGLTSDRSHHQTTPMLKAKQKGARIKRWCCSCVSTWRAVFIGTFT